MLGAEIIGGKHRVRSRSEGDQKSLGSLHFDIFKGTVFILVVFLTIYNSI